MTVAFKLEDGTIISLPPPLAGCGCPERAAGRECEVCRLFREMMEKNNREVEE